MTHEQPGTAQERFLALDAEIPPEPPLPPDIPLVVCRRSRALLYLSGPRPPAGFEMRYTGNMGTALTLEEGSTAARLTRFNLLLTARHALGSLNAARQRVELLGPANNTPRFAAQPAGDQRLLSQCLHHVFRKVRLALAARSGP